MNCKTGQKNAEQIVVLSIVIVLLNVRKAGKPLQVFYSNQLFFGTLLRLIGKVGLGNAGELDDMGE